MHPNYLLNLQLVLVQLEKASCVRAEERQSQRDREREKETEREMERQHEMAHHGVHLCEHSCLIKNIYCEFNVPQGG